MSEFESRRQEIERILQGATPLLLEGYSAVPGADRKRADFLGTQAKSSPKDLVTVFDKRVEELLTRSLEKSFPGETIVGEEALAASGLKPADHCRNLKANEYWLIDPIDGTTNYSRAYPFFCSTIAFVSRSVGNKAQACATWDPLRQEMFSASRGQGAHLNRERLQVSPVDRADQSLLTTGFASERAASGQRSFELFTRLTKGTLGVRRDGSAALDLAYVAAGRIDGYWEWGLAPYDTAAGILLVEEAGGKLSNLEGESLDPLNGEILASNGFLHKWLLDRIKETSG